jgi:hypothetical protein
VRAAETDLSVVIRRSRRCQRAGLALDPEAFRGREQAPVERPEAAAGEHGERP